MHPYRFAQPPPVTSDEDVRAFARRARRMRRVSVSLALAGALGASFALIDWPFAADVLSGQFLGH
jgi:hypothetical protein